MTPREILLDSNTLIALAVPIHMHHQDTASWLGNSRFATCPITEGALVRIVSQHPGGSIGRALDYLRAVTSSDRHEFWSDDVPYGLVTMTGVVGHKQVTDAYLAELARRRSRRVATLDRGFAALHPDVAELVPTP